MVIFIYFLLFFSVEILLFVKSLKTKNTKYWKILILVEFLSIISIILLILLSPVIFANKEFGLQTLELLHYNYIAIIMYIVFAIISGIILSIIYFKKRLAIVRGILGFKKAFIYFVAVFVILLMVVLGQQKLYKHNVENLKEESNTSYLLMRFAYRGIENLFHDEYEYYLIKNNKTCFVFTSNQISYYFNQNLNDLSIYEDKNTNYYFVDLRYSPDGNFGIKNNDQYINVSIGDKYKLFYSNWTNNSITLSKNDKNVMKKIVEQLHDGYIENYTSNGGKGSSKTLVSFMLIKNNKFDYYIVEKDDKELFVFKNDKLTKLIDIPNNGDFDYFYFIDNQLEIVN